MKLAWLMLCATSFVFGSERPGWINETPAGYAYDYFTGTGKSNRSESDARSAALADAVLHIVQNGTIFVQGNQKYTSQKNEVFRDNRSLSLDVIDNVVSEIKIVGESKIVDGLREEEYYSETNGGVFTVWSLIKIPKRVPIPYEAPSKFTPVWRSALLPGWGQFTKGQPTKGYCIAGGTALSLASGLIFLNLRTTAESDARNSRTQVLRDYYNDRSNLYNNVSLACFIVSTAIYVYNIVDAVGSEAEKEYVFEPPTIKMECRSLTDNHVLFSYKVAF